MNQELEALILAYDAALEPSPDEIQRRALFESRMDDALAARPGLDRETLLKANHFRCGLAKANP